MHANSHFAALANVQPSDDSSDRPRRSKMHKKIPRRGVCVWGTQTTTGLELQVVSMFRHVLQGSAA